MNAEKARAHPEPEVLAAFVEGSLAGSELQSVAEHLRECEDCRFVVGEAAEFRRSDIAAASGRGRWVRWGVPLAAAAALTAVAVLGPLRDRFRDPLASFQPDEHRIIEPRLTAFDYAPFRVTRAAEGDPDYRRMSAAAELQERLKSERSAANLHRFALAELALGRVASAKSLLEEAARLEPENGRIVADLAAAHFAAGDYSDAVEHSARALARDPSLAAAAFNHALALERTGNRRAAIEAWKKYLTIDSDSKWGGEARTRLEALERQRPAARWEEVRPKIVPGLPGETLLRIAREHPRRARDWVLVELLPRWVESGSEADLELAKALGECRAETGDALLRDIVGRAARDDRDFVQGLRSFVAARAAERERYFDAAAAHHAAAAEALARAGSPLADLAAVYAATNDHYAGRTVEGLARLDQVSKRLRERPLVYASVSSELDWLRGLILAKGGRNGEALERLGAALDAAVAAGETENAGGIRSVIVSVLDLSGSNREAERLRSEVLRSVERTDPDSVRAYNAYLGAAYAELAMMRPRAALAANAAQRTIAAGLGDPLLQTEASLVRALAHRDAGELEKAVEAIAEARKRSAGIVTEGLREKTVAEIDYVEGTVHLTSDPARAATVLGRAIATWERHDFHVRLALARTRRGEAHWRLGRHREAEADLRAAVGEVERQRENLAEPRFRIGYLEESDAIFVRLIELLLDRGRPVDALIVAERRRARSLLDRVSGRAAVPGEEMLRRVPAGTAVVEYVMLASGPAIWSIRDGEVRFARSRAGRGAIEELVARHRQALQAGDAAAEREVGRTLFEELVGPVEAHVAGANSVVVVPDGALHDLSFASLVSSEGRYWVESQPLLRAPSCATFVAMQRPADGIRSLLAVAPRVDDLPPLPMLEREVEAVASLYERRTLLSGTSATKARVLERIASVDVIHLAAHAVPAGDGSVAIRLTDGELSVTDVESLRLGKAPLVVLAACSTGRGAKLRSEGLMGLSREFLRAGARGVVATLWDVDDAATARILGDFHRRLRAGQPVASALRLAQLEVLRDQPHGRSGSASAWAGLVVVGTN